MGCRAPASRSYAYLGPAVRAFFRNGGRRCWVVRVADSARAETNRFPLPGILALATSGAISQGTLAARSPGSAADGLRVTASIAPEPVRLRLTATDPVAFDAFAASESDLAVGDTIRVTFAGSEWTLVFAVASVAPGSSMSGTGSIACWAAVATVDPGAVADLRHHSPPSRAVFGPPTADGLASLSIPVLPSAAPEAGAVVEASVGDRTLWLVVDAVEAAPDGATALLVKPFQVSFEAPVPTPAQAAGAFAERLTLDLGVTDGNGNAWSLGGLGPAAGHPSFAGRLPSDESLYGGAAPPVLDGPLAHAASAPRFPLAGPADPPALYLPLGGSILAGPSLGAITSGAPERQRDGLDVFGAALFLDRGLAMTSEQVLLDEADWIRFQSPDPRALAGIHSLLSVDEVTIVAVPDAINRGWSPGPISEPLPAHIDVSPPELSPPEDGRASAFRDCAGFVAAAPQFDAPSPSSGIYTLSWSETDLAGALFELQEAADPGFGEAETIYRGAEHRLSIFGRSPGGSWFYRVRTIAPASSEWSSTLNVRIPPGERLVLDAPEQYSSTELALLHQALLRMCSARGDLVGVLALPQHYAASDAVSYAQALRGTSTDPITSFGAMYHPWLYSADAADPTQIRLGPPDGAAAGMISATASSLGSWVAPANVPLQDVVDLEPSIGADSYLDFQTAQLNLLRQQPGGFVCLAADTLSGDEDLRPIGVRRLLQALRRLALLQGAAYAFEPDSDVLRRTVQRGFERLLAGMFARGAFAGASAAEAFRVDVGSPPNTEATSAAGQLIVELRVAPSRPMSFITIRLVRSDAGALQVQTR